jgi:hypothetical protein
MSCSRFSQKDFVPHQHATSFLHSPFWACCRCCSRTEASLQDAHPCPPLISPSCLTFCKVVSNNLSSHSHRSLVLWLLWGSTVAHNFAECCYEVVLECSDVSLHRVGPVVVWWYKFQSDPHGSHSFLEEVGDFVVHSCCSMMNASVAKKFDGPFECRSDFFRVPGSQRLHVYVV